MEIVLALRDSCKVTFESVYSEWHKPLYSFIYKKTKSAEIAEEVVQQTFARVWEKRMSLSLNYTIEIQLFRIARTVLIDELRKAAHARAYLDRVMVANPILEDGERILNYRETLNRIKLAIDEMPPMRKKIFQMSRFEDQTYSEISRKLNISPRTVENHISLALKQLKKFLAVFLSLLLGVFYF